MSNLILETQETHRIVGACFEVYRQKGCGFVEVGLLISFSHYRGVEHERLVI